MKKTMLFGIGLILVMALSLSLDARPNENGLAISPDGRSVVYDDGRGVTFKIGMELIGDGTRTRLANYTVRNNTIESRSPSPPVGGRNNGLWNGSVLSGQELRQIDRYRYMIMKDPIDECIFDPFSGCVNTNPIINFMKDCAPDRSRAIDPQCFFYHTTTDIYVDLFGGAVFDPTIETTTNDVRDLDMDTFGDNNFVVCWRDANAVRANTFIANGSQFGGQINFDTNPGTAFTNDIDIDCWTLNSTHYMTFWHDNNDADQFFQVADIEQNQFGSPVAYGTGRGGSNNGVAGDAFNSTNVVLCVYEDPSRAVECRTRDIVTGTFLTARTTIFSNAANGQTSMAVSTLNSSHFAIIFSNETSSNDGVFLSFFNNAFNKLGNTIQLDGSIGQGFSVGVATIDSTKVIAAWYDKANQNIEAAIVNTAGNNIFGTLTIDSTAGSYDGGVGVAVTNSSEAVIIYHDLASNAVKVTALDYTDGSILSTVTLDPATVTPTDHSVSITGSKMNPLLPMCNGNMVGSWAHSNSQSNWTSLQGDLSDWDGECIAINTAPTISNATFNRTSPVDFNTTFLINVTATDAESNPFTITLDLFSPSNALTRTVFDGTNGSFTTSFIGNESGNWTAHAAINDSLVSGINFTVLDLGENPFLTVSPPAFKDYIVNWTGFLEATNDTGYDRYCALTEAGKVCWKIGDYTP